MMRIAYCASVLCIAWLLGACPDGWEASVEVSIDVAEYPAGLQALTYDISHYALRWQDETGQPIELRVERGAPIPTLRIPLYTPVVIVWTPISRHGFRYPSAGALSSQQLRRERAITLRWEGCVYEMLYTLARTMDNFTRFNGRRFIMEVNNRSEGASCLVDMDAIVAKAQAGEMRADSIKPRPKVDRYVLLPAGAWLFSDYTIPNITSDGVEARLLSLPYGVYHILAPHAEVRAVIAITEYDHSIVIAPTAQIVH